MIMIIFIFLLGILIGGIIIAVIQDQKTVHDPELVEQASAEKVVRKKKILNIFETKDFLVNNDVEVLLGVSDATATRYLDELEKEGVIRQKGKTGKYVTYQKI